MTDHYYKNAYINHYKIIKQIGSGAYGLVFLVRDIIANQYYAVKVIAKRSDKTFEKQSDYLVETFQKHLSSLQNLKELSLSKLCHSSSLWNSHPFLREIIIHLKVHGHPNITTIHQVLDSHIAVFVVMDYYSEGDLFTNIVDRTRYINSTPELIRKVFLQLIDAISHCHLNGVYHCDIKPENILSTSNGERLAICDFGLSTTEKSMNSHKCVGSSYYMPPERLTDLESPSNADEEGEFYPSDKGDVWSLGIILINLACMRNPWNKACTKMDHTYKAFKERKSVLKEILPISHELYCILLECLKENPFERISLYDLRKMVANCQIFTTEGPLSIPSQVRGAEEGYTSCHSDIESLNSFGHNSIEDDYETSGFEVDWNKQNLYTEVENFRSFNNANLSTITNASFNINFGIQNDLIPFFHK